MNGAWRDLEVEMIGILRRGQRAPKITFFRRTYRGPVLSDAFPDYKGRPFSLRMTLHEAGEETEGFLPQNRRHARAKPV